MRKPKQCIRILALGLVLVCIFQLALYFYFSDKAFKDDKTESETVENVIRSFVSHADLHYVAVIPFQQSVLQKFLLNGTALPFCFYFCQSKVAVFATFEELFTKKNQFLSTLIENGFRHFAISHNDRKLLAQDIVINVALGHLFLKDGCVLYLTVFHRHDGNFWWHGRFNHRLLALPQEFHLDLTVVQERELTLVDKEGAYNLFEVHSSEVDKTYLYLPNDVEKFLLGTADSDFIECNYTRAKLFYSRYGLDNSEEAAEFKTLAWKILSIGSEALNQLKVQFWLSSGTCLGFFRQCDIFPHGRDVDIGIWIKDYHPRIVEMLVASGMKLKHKFGKIDDSLELSFLYAGIKLDIFFFYEETDHMWNGGLQARTGKKFKYIFPKFTLCWTEFLGLKVRIPCQTQSYVEANYGPGWFTPTKIWDWKSSPYNVYSNGQWPVEEWPEVIQQMDTGA